MIMTSNLGARYLTADQLGGVQAPAKRPYGGGDGGSTTGTAGGSTGSDAGIGVCASASSISDHARSQVMACVRQHFAPEFLNRLDDIVLFQPLSRGHMKSIVKLQVQSVVKRLSQATGFGLSGGGGGSGGGTTTAKTSMGEEGDAGEEGVRLDVKDSALDFVLQNAYSSEYGARPLRRYIEKHLVTALSRMLLAGQVPEGSVVEVSGGAKGLVLEAKLYNSDVGVDVANLRVSADATDLGNKLGKDYMSMAAVGGVHAGDDMTIEP